VDVGTRMRHLLVASLPLLAGCLVAQQPVLHASEVAAYHHLRAWLEETPGVRLAWSPFQLGYDAAVFGVDAAGEPRVDREQDNRRPGVIDAQRTTVLLCKPIRDSWHEARLLCTNRSGRVFVGRPPAASARNWQPSVATFAAPGVPAVIDNLLLESGTAQDGTTWERAESLEGDVLTEQRVRFVGLGAVAKAPFPLVASFPLVEVGLGRLPWHPAWLRVDHLPIGSLRAHAHPAAASRDEEIAKGPGIAARGLHLAVRFGGVQALLRPEDVTFVDGELRVDMARATVAAADELDDQAWAAHALRLFAQDQLAARAANRIDRDRDGRGEFGQPDEVLAANRRNYQPAPNGRFLFRNHLFAVHVPAAADDAEQRFVAYAWPAKAHGPHDLAFAVDERGTVLACPAHDRFAGHDKEPDRAAIADSKSGWKPLP